MRFGAAALAATLLLAACGGGDDEAEPETPETTETESTEPTEEPAGDGGVTIAGFAFDPADLEVAAGTEVTWTNDDSAPHTATADDGTFDTGTLEQGDSGSATFDEPGDFPYHCAIHPDMTGTITVT